jgi:penicillin-binding protein 1C
MLAAGPALAVPGYNDVRRSFVPSDLPLLDRHGTPMHTVRVDASVRRGAWLTLAEVSPALRDALVLSEDRRFWAHGGVDWQALAASAWANAWNTRTRGASTLTMQLAGLLQDDMARPAGGRSVGQKLTQMARAQQLETSWTKAQILEAYLNHVPLRGELVGVAAASQVLFGKVASGLDPTEAAVLAVMVRGPNANAATLERRACEVLRQQRLGCAPLAITISQALARRPGALRGEGGESLAPHLAQRMASQWAHQTAAAPRGPAAPLALRSTLDARVQRAALAALRRQLAELRGREVEDGAVLVLDNASGEVLAWVGSSGAGSAAAEVDAVLARRQPGSTLKPFVYGLALQQKLVTPASLIEDAPLQIHAGGALYTPQNYDHAYKGWVSVRTALASSLNVPAVRVGSMLGPEALFAKLNEAGLQLTESAGYHGHALALGSADVTLLALTNAYRMLANGGRFSTVTWLPGGPPPAARPARAVFDAAVAWQVADMLADPAARATTFGFDSPLVTRGWAAVKTGTSKDMRDNWCIGFTQRYTVGVWVGNASGAPMHQVSGVSGAAPVWREVVAWLHAGDVSRPPAAPQGLVARGGEWFVAGTEPLAGGLPTPQTAGAMAAFGIQSPRDGSVVLLDPEIPMAAQQMVFAGAAGRWQINGRPLGSGTSVHWLPRPGRHVLERRDVGSAATAPDRVVFEVRAAPPPGATAATAATARSGRNKRTTAPNA